MGANGALFAFVPRANLYVECADEWVEDGYYWPTCGDCGWDGSGDNDPDAARRGFWRHPWLICWLRRRGYAVRHWHAMLPWRRPVKPCNTFGHTWSGLAKKGDRCYCSRAKWKTRRV